MTCTRRLRSGRPDTRCAQSRCSGTNARWSSTTAKVRTSSTRCVDLDGPYAAQDIRLIQKWKDEYGRKDGRALVRWALSFVDQSSVAGQQIELVKKMSQLALPGTASLY